MNAVKVEASKPFPMNIICTGLATEGYDFHPEIYFYHLFSGINSVSSSTSF